MVRAMMAAIGPVLVSSPLEAGVEPFPANFQARQIATNGTSLSVRVGGEGPAVGYGETGDMWAPLAEKLAKKHTVIGPTSRHGPLGATGRRL